MGRLKELFKDINESAERISRITGRGKLSLKMDMLSCLLKYKASPNNYEKFEFYRLKRAKRKTYVTYGISRKMITRFNAPEDIDCFEDKLKFAELFGEFYKREYLDSSKMSYDEFSKFCEGKEKFICKPNGGSQGANICVYRTDDIEKTFNEIKSKQGKYIIEEWISQHEDLSKIYPNAVNCFRIITVFDGNDVNLLTGGITFGVSTEIANGSQPSIVAPVDFNTGIIHKPAATFGSELYENHPTTGARILGVKVPFWNEILKMLDSACRKVPTVGYIGWDVAITPCGPVIIEGNTTPGYKYYQIPAHLSDGIGNKDVYAVHLKRKKTK